MYATSLFYFVFLQSGWEIKEKIGQEKIRW